MLPSDLHPEEDNEDVPVELSTLVATEVDKVDLSTGYTSVCRRWSLIQ